MFTQLVFKNRNLLLNKLNRKYHLMFFKKKSYEIKTRLTGAGYIIGKRPWAKGKREYLKISHENHI